MVDVCTGRESVNPPNLCLPKDDLTVRRAVILPDGSLFF